MPGGSTIHHSHVAVMGGTALAYCIVACWWVANTLDRSLPSRQLEGFIHGCTQQTVPNPNTVYDTELLNDSWMQVMILEDEFKESLNFLHVCSDSRYQYPRLTSLAGPFGVDKDVTSFSLKFIHIVK